MSCISGLCFVTVSWVGMQCVIVTLPDLLIGFGAKVYRRIVDIPISTSV